MPYMGLAADAFPVISAQTASYTIVPTDHGKLFTNKGAAGAVTFTLPAIANVQAGWFVDFYAAVAAQNMAVTAPSGKLVAFNNIAATTATWSTAGGC